MFYGSSMYGSYRADTGLWYGVTIYETAGKGGYDPATGIGDDGNGIACVAVFIIPDDVCCLQGALKIEVAGYGCYRQFCCIPDKLYDFCNGYMEFTGLRVAVYFIIMPLYDMCHGFGGEVVCFTEASFFIGDRQLQECIFGHVADPLLCIA